MYFSLLTKQLAAAVCKEMWLARRGSGHTAKEE